MRRYAHAVIALALSLGACNCGPPVSKPATEIVLGETTLLVWVNPRVNEANQITLPQPGSLRENVTVSVAGGPSVRTNADGVAVLSGMEAGTAVVSFEADSRSGELSVQLEDKELREMAVSLDESGAQLMTELRYRFGGEVVDVHPGMSEAEVNSALTGSNKIVLFQGGTYSGNLSFVGSDVTMFGASADGGTVSLSGSIEIDGSANRIRGAQISGALTAKGSNFGLSKTRIVGPFVAEGSTGVYIGNAFCGTTSFLGSSNTLLENEGLAPLPPPDGGC